MEKLNLPIITKSVQETKSLSMDEYLEFVKFNLKYAFDKKSYRESKKMLAVNVPFTIK